MVVFGDQVTKILHNSLFTFFTEQGKTGKNGTHGNENLATYFWHFGSFEKKTNLQKYVMSLALENNIRIGLNKSKEGNFFRKLINI